MGNAWVEAFEKLILAMEKYTVYLKLINFIFTADSPLLHNINHNSYDVYTKYKNHQTLNLISILQSLKSTDYAIDIEV